MPENLLAPEPPAPDDAPCAYEIRVRLLNGDVDEIGHASPFHLNGYLRALYNHGLISLPELSRQTREVALAIAARALAGTGFHRRNPTPTQ